MSIIISIFIVVAVVVAAAFFITKKRDTKHSPQPSPTPTTKDLYSEKVMVNPPGGSETF